MASPNSPSPGNNHDDKTSKRANRPLFARFYIRISTAMDGGGLAEHRHTQLAGLSGTVIEIGAGNGRNFAHYPPAVTRAIAVGPEPRLRGTAAAAGDVRGPLPLTAIIAVSP